MSEKTDVFSDLLAEMAKKVWQNVTSEKGQAGIKDFFEVIRYIRLFAEFLLELINKIFENLERPSTATPAKSGVSTKSFDSSWIPIIVDAVVQLVSLFSSIFKASREIGDISITTLIAQIQKTKEDVNKLISLIDNINEIVTQLKKQAASPEELQKILTQSVSEGLETGLPVSLLTALKSIKLQPSAIIVEDAENGN